MDQNIGQRLAPQDQVLASHMAQLDLKKDQARSAHAAPAIATAAVRGSSGGGISSSSRGGLGRGGSMVRRASAANSHDNTFEAGPVDQLVCIDSEPSNASTMARTSHGRGFEAMRMVAEQRGQVTHAPHEQAISRFAKEFYNLPTNYAGDPLNLRNQSAPVKDNENTALFITGLPADCNHTMLLKAVAGCAPVGKVYATVINAPKLIEGQLFTAAKLVFFNRTGAENCFKAIKQKRLIVGGCRPRVVWNRIKSAAQPNTSRSRVILIRGPSELVRRDVLDRWFSKKFSYQTEDVLVRRVPQAGVTVLEWRFGSFRAQAEAATMYMSENELEGTKLEWRWEVDPCARSQLQAQV
ncbi:f-box domain-containing protein [Colletotrichum scovillei]|uniref:F-box domain-containing protein n=2 Tax=Colletotrichum scovillei TaxID=1209932 RepID=A0A9P7R6S1_9PEZI|nr:f-box domain-containing protein [Colletotrichum scovillei]KAG7065965.1 f-box domain-containing protein [Colletotrichum scovillei]KAG7068564.1 f-box domain-containing protein [Colletotrichum scovillei]